MQKIDYDAYIKLCENAEVIEQDSSGYKVLRLSDGSFLKFFRRKRLISSSAFKPYAKRFAENATKLRALDIPCPTIIQVFRIPEIERKAVHYHPLPGLTLRQLRDGEGKYPSNLSLQFADFIKQIHHLGIYFRSIHLGNVIYTPQDEIGLIDIADMKVYRRPLSTWQRKRNFAHVVRYEEDAAWLASIFEIKPKQLANHLLEPPRHKLFGTGIRESLIKSLINQPNKKLMQ